MRAAPDTHFCTGASVKAWGAYLDSVAFHGHPSRPQRNSTVHLQHPSVCVHINVFGEGGCPLAPCKEVKARRAMPCCGSLVFTSVMLNCRARSRYIVSLAVPKN
eukprot:1161192-Pelagomonas_calceolata.AAC.9